MSTEPPKAGGAAPAPAPAAAAPTPALPQRRLAPRKILRRAATAGLPDGTVLSVKTVDLGLDGASLVASQPLKPGGKCMLTLEAPVDGKWLRLAVAAKVVYCALSGVDGFKLGLVFVEMNADSARVLGGFLR